MHNLIHYLLSTVFILIHVHVHPGEKRMKFASSWAIIGEILDAIIISQLQEGGGLRLLGGARVLG